MRLILILNFTIGYFRNFLLVPKWGSLCSSELSDFVFRNRLILLNDYICLMRWNSDTNRKPYTETFCYNDFLEIWVKIFAPYIVLQPVRNVPLLLYSSAGVLSLTLLGPIRFRVRYFDLHFKRKLAGGK